MKTRSLALVLVAATLCATGCGGLGRKFNQALPEFMRRDPGAEEVDRYQQRVAVLNRSEADRAAARKAYDAALELYQREEWEDAAKAFETYLEDYPDTEVDEEARLLRARAHLKDDEAYDAALVLRAFMARYPFSPHNDEVEELTFELASAYLRGDHGNFLFSNEGEGMQLFRDLVLNFPKGRYADTAHWRMGNWSFDEGEFVEAEASYHAIVEHHPESPWASRAQFNRGIARLRMVKGVDYDEKLMTDTIADFRDYLARYPDGDRRAEAEAYVAQLREMLGEKQVAIGDWYEDQGFPRAARFYYLRATKHYPETAAVATAKLRLDELPALEPLDVGAAPDDAPPIVPVPPEGPEEALELSPGDDAPEAR